MNGLLILMIFQAFGSRPECLEILSKLDKVEDMNQLVQIGFGLHGSNPQCPIARGIAEVASVILTVHNDSSKISVTFLEYNLNQSSGVLSNPSLWEEGWIGFTRLLRVLGSFTRPVLSRSTVSGCRNSHRYKASAITAFEKQGSLYLDPSAVFPIASRIRDIGISRTRCPEDTFVSVLSVARSMTQLVQKEELRGFLQYIGEQLTHIGIARLLGIQQPVLEMLEALARSRYLAGTTYVLPFSHNQLHRQIILTEFDSEAQTVVSHFKNNLNSTNIDKDFRKDFLFLQSINAGWFEAFRSGWGKKITGNLSALRKRQKVALESDHSRFPSGQECGSTVVADSCLRASTTFSIGDSLRYGVELLASVDTRCNVEISSAFVMIQRALMQALAGRNDPLSEALFKEDAGMLMEMAWQTIAGDRLSDLIHHEVPIFELMYTTWSE
jgi:hypothetical protein